MRAPRLTPVLLIAALAVAASCSEGGQQSSRDADKVTICHATSSSGNPFTQNSVDKDGTVSGHDGHPNDIIPPFDYLDNNGASQQYPGKNWTGEGQAIHDNGCTPVTSTSEPTTTTATEATEGPVTNEPEGTGGGEDVTTEPPASATDAPAASEPAGTGEVVTSEPAGTAEAVTTAPAESTTVPSGGSEPPGTGGGAAVDPNQVTTSPSVAPVPPGTGGGEGSAEAAGTGAVGGGAGAGDSTPDTSLSETGTDTGSLVLVGATAVLVGAIVLFARRASLRRS